MPTRYLKPGIRDSERINALSAEAEVFYYRLIVTVDDFGRADARPAMLKAACFPVRDSATSEKCSQWLAELAQAGLVDTYSHDGKPYLQMQRWDNQPRAKESKFPAPAYTCMQTHADADNSRTVLPGTGTGTGTDNREPETGTDARARVSPAGTICLALKKAGVSKVNPGHPRLLSLIEAGAEESEFVGFAQRAIESASGDPFPYILAAVEKERIRAKATNGALHHGRLPNKQEALEQRNRQIAEDFIKKLDKGEHAQG